MACTSKLIKLPAEFKQVRSIPIACDPYEVSRILSGISVALWKKYGKNRELRKEVNDGRAAEIYQEEQPRERPAFRQ